ncbi:MAG TPA: sugar transferase [Edaphobacter sp.]|nr:sugar transferase [Edaphobacter sp.]
MQAEYQSPESRTAAIEDSYSHTETISRAVFRYPLDAMPSELFRYRIIKRCIDVLLIFLCAPLIAAAIGTVSLLVMISSPGPVFYSHRRIRKNGSFFSMWKFRTMCVNSAEVLEEYLSQNPVARAEWTKTHKLRHDPRITRLGAILRRYSLDELPQLWNVLAGHMSLVGPRPIVAAEVEKYGDCFECYCRVKPGLTGLWQVSGRSELTYDERVALDCEYVNRWSLSKDVQILMRTFAAVVNQDGAY